MRILVLRDTARVAVEMKGKARVKATKRVMRMIEQGQTPGRALLARTGVEGRIVAKGANARTVGVARRGRDAYA